jgi:hypothetical protein
MFADCEENLDCRDKKWDTLLSVACRTTTMESEIIACVPGPWAHRTDFIGRVITHEPKGKYVFAGMILADVQEKDHVELEFCESDGKLTRAFEIGGAGKIPVTVLEPIEKHTSIVYIRFPLDLMDQRERMLKYTKLLQDIGGLAIKLENSGVAHNWEHWFGLLSGNLFDVYRASVALVGDSDCYYSCGMHYFKLPDCSLTNRIPINDAADLMNRFNYWQLAEHPTLESGHTFSVSESSPHFRLALERDSRHEENHPFHNSQGLWHLAPC